MKTKEGVHSGFDKITNFYAECMNQNAETRSDIFNEAEKLYYFLSGSSKELSEVSDFAKKAVMKIDQQFFAAFESVSPNWPSF